MINTRRPSWPFAVAVCLLSMAAQAVGAAEATLKISRQALHAGRIQPMLFGNFIELLDDLVPGMRAEMLNDRGFEGITPPANWVYYDGAPTFCDRPWDMSGDWTAAADDKPFTGRKCAKVSASGKRPARLAQSGLAVKQGSCYFASGWYRSEGTVRIQVALEERASDGSVIDLAKSEEWQPTTEYTRFLAKLQTNASSDRVSFVVCVIGKGTVWADQLSLMPDDNLQGWRRDVVEAIKASRPGLVRWGGSVVDPGAYRWKNGIGARDRRQPFANAHWGRIDSNEVGIDEFCQFCALVRAEPLICLSFADGAASAGDLVSYCNAGPETVWGARRVTNGHPAPYRVKYWQLGNELAGDDTYIAKCKDFIAAIKKADPTALVLGSYPSQKLLTTLGKDLAYVAPHHYTRDLGACEADFQRLAHALAATNGCEHLRLAVTEWNFTGGDWGLLRAKMLTLEGALRNARYLNLLCRRCDIVDIACRSNMTNSFCSGIIETKPGCLLKRPSYHVMKLYAEHALPRPLEIAAAPANIDVVVCASEDRKRVNVFAVNNGRAPVPLTLDLTDLGADIVPLRAKTVRDTQDRRQPDVMNHWDTPNRVGTVSLRCEENKIVLPAFSVSVIECGQK